MVFCLLVNMGMLAMLYLLRNWAELATLKEVVGKTRTGKNRNRKV
jgi:hypothetical protein